MGDDGHVANGHAMPSMSWAALTPHMSGSVHGGLQGSAASPGGGSVSGHALQPPDASRVALLTLGTIDRFIEEGEPATTHVATHTRPAHTAAHVATHTRAAHTAAHVATHTRAGRRHGEGGSGQEAGEGVQSLCPPRASCPPGPRPTATRNLPARLPGCTAARTIHTWHCNLCKP